MVQSINFTRTQNTFQFDWPFKAKSLLRMEFHRPIVKRVGHPPAFRLRLPGLRRFENCMPIIIISLILLRNVRSCASLCLAWHDANRWSIFYYYSFKRHTQALYSGHAHAPRFTLGLPFIALCTFRCYTFICRMHNIFIWLVDEAHFGPQNTNKASAQFRELKHTPTHNALNEHAIELWLLAIFIHWNFIRDTETTCTVRGRTRLGVGAIFV